MAQPHLHLAFLGSALHGFWRFILICADITNTYLRKSGPHHSAAITYYAIFSLIPLTLVIMFILGTFFAGSQSRISLAVNTLVPVSSDTVADTLRVLNKTRAVSGVLGLIGVLWISTTVFGAIRKGVNTIWGIDQSRRFFHEKFIDFCFAAGAGLVMVVPIAITAGVGVLTEFTSTLRTGSPDRDWLAHLLLTILSPFLSFIVFMFIYRYLPNNKETFRVIWPGALMATVAFEGWKAVFLWYTRSFPVYDTVYGPVGALVALLSWIYISANILLVGALVTSKYSEYLSRRVEEMALWVVGAPRRLLAPSPAGTADPVEND